MTHRGNGSPALSLLAIPPRLYVKHKNPTDYEVRATVAMEIFILREKATFRHLLSPHCLDLVSTFASEKSSDSQLHDERDWLKRLLEIG